MNKFIIFLIYIINVFSIIIFIPTESIGKEVDHAHQYHTCMELSKSTPQKAFDTALNWYGWGGGDAADHCIAVALIGLKQYKEAARRLEKLALKARQKREIKKGLLAHAAQAWILAKKSIRAEELLTAALKLMPDDAALMIDRAQARAGQQNYTGAINDLTNAIKYNNHLIDAFIFRASAYRFINNLEAAQADIEHALKIQPNNPEGLLERGNLRRLLQDDIGARKDWLTLIQDSPKSLAAESARQNIEILNLKIN